MSEIRRERLPETIIPGRRLGRHIEHDERSRDFAVKASTGLVSVRHHRLVPVFDQGSVGDCTAESLCGAMSTRPFTHHIRSQRTCQSIYHAETLIDGFGAPWPTNDRGSSGLAAAKVAKAKGWISSYSHAFSPEAVYTALQTGPVMLGVSWLGPNFDNPTPDGRMPYGGTSRGGHELCADELDVENQRIWITNSWSSSWGLNGRAWWSWADFAHVLADSGDATQPNK